MFRNRYVMTLAVVANHHLDHIDEAAAMRNKIMARHYSAESRFRQAPNALLAR